MYDASKIKGARKTDLRDIIEDIDVLTDGVTDALDELDDADPEDRDDAREGTLDAVNDLLSRAADLNEWREKLKTQD